MRPEAAVSAPGKTILLGEHAAVYGHPALVTAVDLRLTVAARSIDTGGVSVRSPSAFRTGTLPWDEVVALCREPRAASNDLAYIAAGEAALHVGAAGGTGIELTITSGIPPGSGLGSSAALAVAGVAATLTHLGASHDAATIARLALAVEMRRHGRPSGVDVEAVLRGGTLWCRRGLAGVLPCSEVKVSDSRLASFHLFHAGTPDESTGEMVASVGRLAGETPGRVRKAMEAIDAAAREARAVLEGAPAPSVPARLIPLLRRAEAALESLGVVPATVASAIRAIEAAGGAAKISGAGGRSGGAGLVLVVLPDAQSQAGAIVPSAWTPLPHALGAAGMREEVAA